MAEVNAPLHPGVTVRLYTDKKCFGPGVAQLLRRIEALRSLRAAAQDMEMAYSKAWSILRGAEEGLGFKLVSSTTGGKGGGGAVLTPQGLAFLEAFEAYEAAVKAQGDALFQTYLAPLLR